MSVKSRSTKSRISITILKPLNILLENEAKSTKFSKSTIVEDALKVWFEKKLKMDAKKLSKMRFNDLPTEKEWDFLQSDVNPL